MPSPLLEFIRFLASLIVLTIVLYVAGVIVVGKKRALFTDAFVIALLGTIISTFFMVFLPGRIGAGLGSLLSFFVYLLLIRHYYETGWLGALAVAILAVIIFVVFTFILSILLVIPFLFLS